MLHRYFVCWYEFRIITHLNVCIIVIVLLKSCVQSAMFDAAIIMTIVIGISTVSISIKIQCYLKSNRLVLKQSSIFPFIAYHKLTKLTFYNYPITLQCMHLEGTLRQMLDELHTLLQLRANEVYPYLKLDWFEWIV